MARSSHRAARSLAAAAALFAAGQASLAALLESRPELRSPEFAFRLERLQRTVREEPGRPLALALGSSRTALGLRPDVLDDVDGALLFNFGLSGAGPEEQCEALDNLLRRGIRPYRVLVEVLPAIYTRPPSEPWTEPVAELPCSRHRIGLVNYFARSWVPRETRGDHVRAWQDRWGWLDGGRALSSADRDRQRERTRSEYAAALARGELRRAAVAALDALLERCRVEDIGALVYLMPEDTAFRSWYAPECRAATDRLLDHVRTWHGVTIVDARTWATDDDFADGHHLLPAGAARFTARLGRAWCDQGSPSRARSAAE